MLGPQAQDVSAARGERVLLAAAALFLIPTGLVPDLIGLALLALAFGLQRMWHPAAPAPA
ncbi:MAG: hypothetical protein ACRDIC_16590 [bacterium]